MNETNRITLGFSEDPAGWNDQIAHLPSASILQTSEWAEVKASGGWRPLFSLWKDGDGQVVGAALILRKKLVLNLEFWYIPRGPLLDWADEVLRDRILADIVKTAKRNSVVFIKIDPDLPTGFGVPGTETFRENLTGRQLLDKFQRDGWQFSPQQIQFANSIWIDTIENEDTLLAAMKQRTRYKVRLAEKKGVVVRHGTDEDFVFLSQLYQETSERDGFLIRDQDYYLDVWSRFYENGMLTPLIAEVEGQPIAAIMLFSFAARSWYIYGMSGAEHREKMPNYLLQWEAIRTARAKGSVVYDLWGAPDVFDESDRMWGVYQFKRGLGGYEVITPGAWDLPLKGTLYRLFVRLLPRFLSWLKRKRN